MSGHIVENISSLAILSFLTDFHRIVSEARLQLHNAQPQNIRTCNFIAKARIAKTKIALNTSARTTARLMLVSTAHTIGFPDLCLMLLHSLFSILERQIVKM